MISAVDIYKKYQAQTFPYPSLLEVEKAEGIWRATSCDECDNRNPLWHLTAKSAVRNKEKTQVTKN